MSSHESPEVGLPVPGLKPGATVEPAHGPTLTEVIRDGQTWQLGTASDVAWITSGTTVDVTITSAIPAVFDAYMTIVIPRNTAEQSRYSNALMSVLRAHSMDQRWWLGYLETHPADDVVFPEASRVQLYANWPYVLVQAGPEQAASWRSGGRGPFRSVRLPDLVFPIDRCWLASTLWDDDWTCIGGSAALIDELRSDSVLGPHCRKVELGHDATPPGHKTM